MFHLAISDARDKRHFGKFSTFNENVSSQFYLHIVTYCKKVINVCGLERAVQECKKIIFSVFRPKKVNVKCAKDELNILGLSKEISAEDVCELFNIAAQFVGQFLSLQRKFVGEPSSDDSTGTTTTDDDEHLHAVKFDAPPKSPNVSSQEEAAPTSQGPAPPASHEGASTSKVE